MDQIIIGDKASIDDFSASVASRKIKMPKKKSIKESVPFSNITHDFSAIDGEIYWEDRELEYVFEITANNPEELEALKSQFCSWVMGVMNQELHDPYIPDYHFLATYDSMDTEDDDGLDKSTLTVKFTAYPYMISNDKTVYIDSISRNEKKIIEVNNESAHSVALTIENSVQIYIRTGSASATLPVGSSTYSTLKLLPGVHEIEIYNSEARTGTVQISFSKEVF